MPSRSVALITASFLLFGAPARGADFVGAFTWHDRSPQHGGYSGLEVAADGATFTAVSDRAGIVRGRLNRTRGTITGVEAEPMRALTDRNGDTMSDQRGDSEGLAISDAGEIFVSFEGNPRVWAYDALGAPPRGLPRAREFSGLGSNAALEALAIDPDGALYTIPEEWGRHRDPFPVWRFSDDQWTTAFTIPKRGGYLPVGADFDDRGRLYVLERHFSILGFSSRVRRFTTDADGRLGEERLLQSDTRRHDNLEGLAVWRDPAGDLRLTMISDDNFRFFQRTEFVEYRVPD